MDPTVQEEVQIMTNPVTFVQEFLASYGWFMLGGLLAAAWAMGRLRPQYERWRQAREDAEYHKDPDKALARMEAIQLARERQQQRLEEESCKAREVQQEREERKRAETVERLEKYGGGRGSRLGGDEFLPLGGASGSSSYKPPKRSACSGGGCGR